MLRTNSDSIGSNEQVFHRKCNIVKDCVRYIFASLFFMFKR